MHIRTAAKVENYAAAVGRSYRGDIDGLRALAVVSVMLFHVGAPYSQGGFVGVDVFFVISGYLITQILAEEIDGGRFSLTRFYERRVRRILPALFVVIAVSWAVAFVVLLPREFSAFAKSAAAAALSVSNILFAEQTGYFDLGSDLKPLLHTWSLGVEEQFYVVFPVYFYVCRRYFRLSWMTTIVPVAAVSAAIGIMQTQAHPSLAFFWPMSRAWEFLLGSALAVGLFPAFRKKWLAELSALVGLGLILGATILFDRDTLFPGISALVPCLGAGLLLQANSTQRTWIGALFSISVVRGVGLISFSLYLWHWPLLAFARILFGSELGPWVYTGLFVATFPIAWLSWRFVERPLRQNKARLGQTRLFLGAGAIAATFLVIGLLATKTDGWPSRFSPSALAIAMPDKRDRTACMRNTIDEIRRGDVCAIGAAEAPVTFVVIGDSFAGALFPGLDVAARAKGMRGLLFARGGCFPLLGAGDQECRDFVAAAIEHVSGTPAIETIILVSRWGAAAEASRFGAIHLDRLYIRDSETRSPSAEENRAVFTRGINRSLEAVSGRRVVIVTGIPEQLVNVQLANAPRQQYGMPLFMGTPRSIVELRYRNVRKLLNAELHGNVTVLDLTDALCDARLCRAMDGIRPLYADDNHLNEYGAMSLAPILSTAFVTSSLGLSNSGEIDNRSENLRDVVPAQ
jgi:peptidoglycan/LPS O-acetylase OafA/YrhL